MTKSQLVAVVAASLLIGLIVGAAFSPFCPRSSRALESEIGRLRTENEVLRDAVNVQLLDETAPPRQVKAPKYIVVLWGPEKARIVSHGKISPASFRRHFLEPYVLGGERYHPADVGTICGFLVASDEDSIVTVPIWTWKASDGKSLHLCQATDDGSPPEFSVFSYSELELLKRIEKDISAPAP
jgi:hypothetical protein